MKAVQFEKHGDPLRLVEVEKPRPGPGEVLVKVEASALNPLDILVARGAAQRFFEAELPYTPATDVAGTVEAVGEGVTEPAPGARVIGWLVPQRGGALAEYAIVAASDCALLPSGLSTAEGAGIPTAGSTAFHALFSLGGLTKGERVLVHAGAGGVGSFAVQFAAKAGAHVIATASGDGIEFVRGLGASEVIDYKNQDFAAEIADVDLVLDLVGGETRSRSYGVVKKGGRLVSVVAPLDEAEAERHGVKASMFFANKYHSRLSEVVDTVAAQGIAVPIQMSVPLASFDEAWQAQAGRRARGKIVIEG